MKNEYEEFLNEKVQEEVKTSSQTTNCSLPINDENNYNNNNDNEQEEQDKCKYDIGIQTIYKFQEIKSEDGINYIRYKAIEIKNKKDINAQNNKEEKNQTKEEIGTQTNNYYEENEIEINNNFLNMINENIINNKLIINNDIIIDVKANQIIDQMEKKPILGRKTKRSGLSGKHNKYSIDNIIRKVKNRFINSAFNYINKQFKNKKLALLKIVGKQGMEINRNKNILWLKKTMKDVFYEDISLKTFNSNKDYNRELIDKIFLEKEEQNVIDLLNLNILDFMKLYCSKDKIDGMEQLDDVINELKLKGEDETYLSQFRNVSMNFKTIFLNQKSRERNNIK